MQQQAHIVALRAGEGSASRDAAASAEATTSGRSLCVAVMLEPLCPVYHTPHENIICHQNDCFWKLSCLF